MVMDKRASVILALLSVLIITVFSAGCDCPAAPPASKHEDVLAAIIAHCREFLTGYKVPRIVEFRDELPKTNVGKILRRELR